MSSRFQTPWLDRDPRSPRVAPAAPNAQEPRSERAPAGNWQAQGPPAGRPAWTSAAFIAFGLLALGTLGLAAGGSAESVAGVVAAVAVLFVTYVIARAFARLDDDARLVPIIMGGICLKLIGSFAKYRVSTTVYKTGDFLDYDEWGRRISASLRQGHLLTPPGRLAGTNFIRIVTGFVYFAMPARLMAGFVIYSFLSFVGLLFFWRAYRVGLSPHHDVTYLQWIVIMPSLLYWPSSIGKDAFMVLAAGIAAYGAACLLVNRTLVGFLAMGAGIYGMVMVRPHFALAVAGGLAFASLLRRQRGGLFRTLISLAFVVVITLVAVQAAKSFFGISAFNHSSITKTLNDASAQSADGGSVFSPVVVNNPIQFPLAAATVLYRPLPFEAHSPQEMLTAFEGLVLVGLTIRGLPRILRTLRRGRDLPYVLYCLGAIIVFVYAFSGFSNFGILARERAVIQPLFLVILALPRDPDELIRDGEEIGTVGHAAPVPSYGAR